jgi:hypothetical protein
MDLARIKDHVRQMAANSKNVRFEEIDVFIRQQLIASFGGSSRSNGSHHTYTVADRTFGIPRRSGQIKLCYVRSFLEAMEALGLYDPESEEQRP